MNRDNFKSVPLNSECISLSYLLLHAFGSWMLLKSITGCSPSCILLVSANDITSQYCIIPQGKRRMEQVSVSFCLKRTVPPTVWFSLFLGFYIMLFISQSPNTELSRLLSETFG